jgi:hypothetical protein
MQASGQSQAAERLLFDQYESRDDKTDGFAMDSVAIVSKLPDQWQLEQSRQVADIMINRLPAANFPS